MLIILGIQKRKLPNWQLQIFNALTWYEKEFVVIAMYGASVGNIAISQISSYTNQACCVLKAKDDDLRYLFFFFKCWKRKYVANGFWWTHSPILVRQ